MGTATGVIWGYMTIAYLSEYFWAVQLMLFVWIFLVGVVRSSLTYAPAGTVEG
jgi:hypothetical protein